MPLSSIQMSAPARRPAAFTSRALASTEPKPRRKGVRSTRASEASRRSASERFVISSEKIATFLP